MYSQIWENRVQSVKWKLFSKQFQINTRIKRIRLNKELLFFQDWAILRRYTDLDHSAVTPRSYQDSTWKECHGLWSVVQLQLQLQGKESNFRFGLWDWPRWNPDTQKKSKNHDNSWQLMTTHETQKSEKFQNANESQKLTPITDINNTGKHACESGSGGKTPFPTSITAPTKQPTTTSAKYRRSHPWSYLTQSQKCTGKLSTRIDMPLILVHLAKTADNQNIYNFSKLEHVLLNVEPLKARITILQCHSCQNYGQD